MQPHEAAWFATIVLVIMGIMALAGGRMFLAGLFATLALVMLNVYWGMAPA